MVRPASLADTDLKSNTYKWTYFLSYLGGQRLVEFSDLCEVELPCDFDTAFNHIVKHQRNLLDSPETVGSFLPLIAL